MATRNVKKSADAPKVDMTALAQALIGIGQALGLKDSKARFDALLAFNYDPLPAADVDALFTKVGFVDKGFGGKLTGATVKDVRSVLVMGATAFRALQDKAVAIAGKARVTSNANQLRHKIAKAIDGGATLESAAAQVELAAPKSAAAIAKSGYESVQTKLRTIRGDLKFADAKAEAAVKAAIATILKFEAVTA